ncbi:MAG: hypothetical protein ACLR4Z_06870 [Butyricicoccaceae bacterium]
MENGIYHDISTRTGGDIYIGVVGPVRTGKSTFIKRLHGDHGACPAWRIPYKRERARDELPQSGAGRTIMTAEPKFVPEEAAEIALPEGGVMSRAARGLRWLSGRGRARRHGGRYAAHGFDAVARGTR